MHQDAPNGSEIGLERERESFGDLLSRLANSSAALVRDEIDLAKQEIREKLRTLRTGIILASIAILVGTIALMTLEAAFVIGVGTLIGYGWSALAIGIGWAIVAGIFAGIGMSQFKKTKLKPEETIQSLKEDKEWLKKIT